MTHNTDIIERTKKFFNHLNKETIDAVNDFYDQEIAFKDPLVSFSNRLSLKDYYRGLYNNVSSIHFTFENEIQNGLECSLSWTMEMTCGLNNGNPMAVDGISTIRFGGKEGKAIYHRDYYDMGEFVYERIPIVKNVIKLIKKKLLAH
jgi:hypothetical protein